ncbi:MAG: VOC family protein [Balneolaceae bacterium]
MTTEKNPVIHFEIGCNDRIETKTFYENCFNWKINSDEIADEIDTDILNSISGHITSAVTEINNHLIFYIQVDDIANTLLKIEQAGGKTVVPPVKLPNGETFAWFRDVAGNKVGLMTKPDN